MNRIFNRGQVHMPVVEKNLITDLLSDYPEFSYLVENLTPIINENIASKNHTGIFSISGSYEDKHGYIKELAEFIVNFIPKILKRDTLRVRQEIVVRNVVYYVIGMLFSSYYSDVLDDELSLYIIEEMLTTIVREIDDDQDLEVVSVVKDKRYEIPEELVSLLFSKILTLSGFLFSDLKSKVMEMLGNIKVDGDIIFTLIKKNLLVIKPVFNEDGNKYTKYLFELILILDLG